MASADEEKLLDFIEEVTRNANAVQQNVLAEILSKNASTQYLQDFNLEGASDPREIFKSKIPMISYQDIHPLIRRIVDGDRSPILTANPISLFHLSSGTSGGEIKLIPFSQEELDRSLFIFSLYRPILKRHVKEVEKGKGLCFWFVKDESKMSEDGLRVQTMSSSCFRHIASTPHLQNTYTSPKEAILCPDVFQSTYTQLLCGLYERHHVIWLGATFASVIVRVISFLQLNWQQLAYDIQTATLNPKLTDPSIRHCMALLARRPDPELAEFVAQECGRDDWEGIIARIWPNAKYLETVVTGAMAQYIPTLDYYSGGLPKVSMGYASSECFAGINLNPMCSPSEIAYTIMPNMAYFEFLPLGVGLSEDQLVDLVDVEDGREYEMVITTRIGLYRYRTGDILRVVGFHNSSLSFAFIRRENVVLSIDMEKTDEVQLQTAVENAGRLLHEFRTSVVDYTSFADTQSFPGHYVIYWELGAKSGAKWPSNEVLEQCCVAMEESLDEKYLVSRVLQKVIGPLEIRVVKNGTFQEVMEHAVSRGASVAQYKVARCVKSKEIMDLLDSRVVSNHFSPSPPNWTPKPVLKQ